MIFDPENKIIKLCVKGMELEGEGKNDEAKALFYKAWDEAGDDFEKFSAAHYIARHQPTTEDKLLWDKRSLDLALSLNDESLKISYPSFYLNIAKCYEDLKNYDLALQNYQAAETYAHFLSPDGYGNMIKTGIQNGLQRLKEK